MQRGINMALSIKRFHTQNDVKAKESLETLLVKMEKTVEDETKSVD